MHCTAMYNAMYNAMHNAMYSAMYNAMNNAMNNATYNAMYNAMYSAMYSAMYNIMHNVMSWADVDKAQDLGEVDHCTMQCTRQGTQDLGEVDRERVRPRQPADGRVSRHQRVVVLFERDGPAAREPGLSTPIDMDVTF